VALKEEKPLSPILPEVLEGSGIVGVPAGRQPIFRPIRLVQKLGAPPAENGVAPVENEGSWWR
jgi:hypothetical protein